MKKLLFLILLQVSIGAISQPKRLLLASDVWPPFTNVESRQRVALQLVNEALKRDGVVSLTEIVDFSAVLDGISSGKYQGSAALWMSEERKKDLVFSEPYLENRLVLVGGKGADVSITSLQELGEKKVAVVQDYAYGPELDEATSVEFVLGESDQQNLRKLLADEVDYMLVDDLLIQYLRLHHLKEVGQYLEVGAQSLIVHPLHFAISKSVPEASSTMENFNRRIHEMAADGTYNQILHVNWIQVDADGDGTMEYVLSGNRAGEAAPASSYSLFAGTGGAPPGPGDRYLIDGKVYKGWNAVPGEYKVAPTSDETLNKLRILDFSVPSTGRK